MSEQKYLSAARHVHACALKSYNDIAAESFDGEPTPEAEREADKYEARLSEAKSNAAKTADLLGLALKCAGRGLSDDDILTLGALLVSPAKPEVEPKPKQAEAKKKTTRKKKK